MPSKQLTEMNTGGSSLFTAYSVKTESVSSLTLGNLLDLAWLGACDLMTVALEIHNSILGKRRLSGDDLHRMILSCGYRPA